MIKRYCDICKKEIIPSSEITDRVFFIKFPENKITAKYKLKILGEDFEDFEDFDCCVYCFLESLKSIPDVR